MSVIHVQGLEGAANAAGVAVVIDTFRAFTTAAYAQGQGVGTHYLVSTVEEAREIAERHRGALLCGEVDGVRPDGFDLGNSPAEVLEADIEGRVFVQRTSGGTRCVRAALSSESTAVYAASLVVATATAYAVGAAPTVTIIASGRNGTVPVFEDDATALLINDLIDGHGDPHRTAARVRDSDSAATLAESTWAHPDDVLLATDVDRFDFAMKCSLMPDGSARLAATEPQT
jgi:2-phosphosulfolactate phosphatase